MSYDDHVEISQALLIQSETFTNLALDSIAMNGLSRYASGYDNSETRNRLATLVMNQHPEIPV
jgi:hypothetical protein